MHVFGRRRGFLLLALMTLITVLEAGSSAAADETLKSLVQRAFDLHRKSRYSEALPLLRRAYQLDSKDYFVNLLLGIDLLRTGEPKDSVSFLLVASSLRPKEEFPLGYLGEAFARQGLYGEAAEAYLKALHTVPGSAESSVAFVDFALSRFAGMSEQLRSSQAGLAAEYRLRALALREADVSRRQLLEHAADLQPAAPGIWTDLARATLADGDLAATEQYMHQALEQDPNDLAAWLVDAQLAARRSDWTRTVERINAAARRSPSQLTQAVPDWPPQLRPPASAISGAAARFFSCIRPPTSSCKFPSLGNALPVSSAALYREQRWESLTTLSAPTQAESWFQRGVAFARLEYCDRAIPALERGLRKDTPDVYGMFLLSWCYSREAGHVAEQVHETEGDVAVRLMKGDIVLRLQGNSQAAIVEYQAALAERPDDPAVLERLADAQFGAGKMDDARRSAQSALQLDPQRLSAKSTLAKIAMQERDYVTALPYLREFVARNSQDAVARIELGKASAQTGALDEAWQNLAPALEEGYPDEKGALHYLLGTVLKKMGRTGEAEKAFATARRLSEAFQQKSYRDQEKDAQP